jgi:hypothetical protein
MRDEKQVRVGDRVIARTRKLTKLYEYSDWGVCSKVLKSRKKCRKCCTIHTDIRKFYRDDRTKDGVHGICIQCYKKKIRELKEKC